MGLQLEVGGGVGDANQGKPLAHLLIVQEGLVGLVHGAAQNLGSACGAGAWQGGRRAERKGKLRNGAERALPVRNNSRGAHCSPARQE